MKSEEYQGTNSQFKMINTEKKKKVHSCFNSTEKKLYSDWQNFTDIAHSSSDCLAHHWVMVKYLENATTYSEMWLELGFP